MKKFLTLTLTVSLILGLVAFALAAKSVYTAHLSGAGTKATGQAIFSFNKDLTELRYKLIVANIQNVTAAHIHGMDGMVVAPLYSGPTIQGRFNGTLAEGTIGVDDITCPHHSGEDLSHLIMCIEQGHLYVNVHTAQKPDGEISGTIK